MKVGVDKHGCLINLGTVCLAAEQYNKAYDYFTEALKLKPKEFKDHLRQADALFGMKKYNESLKVYSVAHGLLEQLFKIQPNNNSILVEYLNSKVGMGKCLFESGDLKSAMAIYQSVFQITQEHVECLIQYCRVLYALEKYEEAFEILELVTNIIKKKGVDIFLSQLKTGKIAAAVAFLANVIKEYGAIKESIELFEVALNEEPSNVSYCLNLVHTLEITLEYQKALHIIINFLKRNPNLPVGNYFKSGDFYNILSSIDNMQTDKWSSGDDAQRFREGNYSLIREEDETIHLYKDDKDISNEFKTYPKEYTSEELDLLALYFTTVKILYLNGYLSIIPFFVNMLEPAKKGRNLHQTVIRNEQAYYAEISHLMCFTSQKLPIVQNEKIFVCGDSHSLSSAWHSIKIKDELVTLKPVLVTGLKTWHLRKESSFYPKSNFYNAISSIPKKSKVIFLFGEIDCREGFLLAVEKCKYESVAEAINFAVDIYIDVLKTIEQKYSFDIYVHPVLPVLDITRPMVIEFNKVLEQKIQKVNESKLRLKWLDFFPSLLDEQGKLKKKFELDGTHIHPNYISLIENSINKF